MLDANETGSEGFSSTARRPPSDPFSLEALANVMAKYILTDFVFLR
jgi:hypothetical protein